MFMTQNLYGIILTALAACSNQTQKTSWEKAQVQSYTPLTQPVQLETTASSLEQKVVPKEKAEETFSFGVAPILFTGVAYEPSYSSMADKLVFKGWQGACDICYLDAATKPADPKHQLYNFGEGSKPKIAERGNIAISDKRTENFHAYYLAIYDLENKTQTLFQGTKEVVWTHPDVPTMQYHYGQLENSEQMEISSNGRYIVYVGNGKSSGTEKSPDLEIFLLDRVAETLTQVSQNGGNNPAVNDKGQVIFDQETNRRPSVFNREWKERVVYIFDSQNKSLREIGYGKNPTISEDLFAYEITMGVSTQICYGNIAQNSKLSCTSFSESVEKPLIHSSGKLAYIKRGGIGKDRASSSSIEVIQLGADGSYTFLSQVPILNNNNTAPRTYRLFSLTETTLGYDNDGQWCVAELN